MRRLVFALVASMIAIGCATVTVDEPSVCDSKAMTQLPSVPAGVVVPPGITAPPISFTQQLDLSSTLDKINKVADSVSIGINRLTLDNSAGTMSWLSHVEVDIQSQGMASKVLVQYDLQPGDKSSSQVNLPVLLDTATLYSYLSAGPVTLTFTLSGDAPSQTPELTGTMCISASATATKSL
jgi:hypothetical protein